MFKLNFRIALRNLWRNKTASLINISGLAIGLAACLLLLLYVSYEWSYDKRGKNATHIYQVLTNFKGKNGQIESTGWNTGNVIGPVLKQDYPAVKAATRYSWDAPTLIASGQNSFKKKSRFADAGFLEIFDLNFIAGDKEKALSAPNQVVLTETMAKLLFGTTDVLNKSVKYENKIDLKITGVIQDLPENTSANFDFLMPWSLYETQYDWVKVPQWSNYNWTTVVKLDPATDIDAFNKSISNLVKKNTDQYAANATPFLFPYKDLHLYGNFINGSSNGGRIEQVRLFMGLAIGILLIACINFMNMATARSEKRAKEVGIKKTIGATRGSLVSQFLMESLVLTSCSAIMAIALIELCLPLFNNLLGIQLGIAYANTYMWLSLFAVVLLTGLIAGSYPAFYLSSFNPVQVLKKKNLKRGIQAIGLRQILVVGQFSFALILIIATTVIYQQIQFIRDRPVGYEINELVEMPQDGELMAKFELFKTRLLASGAVTSLYESSRTLSSDGSNFWGLEWPGMEEAGKLMVFNQLATTYDFIQTSGVKLIEGRDFSKKFASDSVAVMLSERAVQIMGLKNPVGQTVVYHGTKSMVVGVFKDFIWGSPFQSDRPMLVAFNPGWNGLVTMRLNKTRPASENMATIERIAKEINPAYPAELSYVDQLYAEKLKSQKVLGILSNLFGGLAIFISCLGLFGLAAYSAEQRTKEIGVRKVLGASVASLMQLLSLSFLKMVVVAIFIAIPAAQYLMNSWLKGFEFHINISWMVILLASIGTVAIAFFTVSFQAYKAARANPVDALKYE
ncbi:ABC transporter permease [Pedobacter sp. AW31-3R]|uniref:ABC transporter permease n=1 Tax=Pedobacter sp. AW31-3R TaxID=3445781 RepID=UPI003FA174C2